MFEGTTVERDRSGGFAGVLIRHTPEEGSYR